MKIYINGEGGVCQTITLDGVKQTKLLMNFVSVYKDGCLVAQ